MYILFKKKLLSREDDNVGSVLITVPVCSTVYGHAGLSSTVPCATSVHAKTTRQASFLKGVCHEIFNIPLFMIRTHLSR